MTDQPFKLKKEHHKNSSVSSKKSGFLDLFNFCSTKQSSTGFISSKPVLHRPAFSIDINNPPTKSMLTADTEAGSFRKYSDPKPPPKHYPQDKVFILGEDHKIVAKITHKRISNYSPLQFSSFGNYFQELMKSGAFEEESIEKEIPAEIKKEIFSMYDKGIKAAEWHEITPENVAVHIAKRLHCNIMIDALCGFGGNTIQFAKYCDYVLSIDIDPEKTLGARHNAQIYEVHNKIDFITVDFLMLKNLVGDVVFLGPSDTRKSPKETYSIFKHAEPDLRNLLAKSLEISYCIALKLPGDTNLDELAELFHVSLERYGLYSKRFCIEIEKILDTNGEVECIVIYFGDCSTIGLQEEYEAIYEYISSKEGTNWRHKYPFQVVGALLHNVGIRRFFSYFSKVEERFNSLEEYKESIFELLLEELVAKNIFTKLSLKKLIDEETHSKSQSFLITRSKSITSSDQIKRPVSSLSPLITSDINQNKRLSPKLGLHSSIKSEPMKTTNQLFRFNTLDDDINHERNAFEERSFEGSKKKITDEEINEDIKDKTNSNEVSELIVSSYSVSSDFFKDYSEDSSPNKENFKITEFSEVSFDALDALERATSLPKESDVSRHYSRRLRTLVMKRGMSQPARNLKRGNDRRKTCNSPDCSEKDSSHLLMKHDSVKEV